MILKIDNQGKIGHWATACTKDRVVNARTDKNLVINLMFYKTTLCPESCFLNISTQTIFECKLGLKDFDEAQHTKYKIVLKEYRIIYLISRDCVIEMEKNCIYTTNPDKYQLYLVNIPTMKNTSYLDELIQEFDIVEIEDLSTLFGLKQESSEYVAT